MRRRTISTSTDAPPPATAASRIALCVAGEMRDHESSVHGLLLAMARRWPRRADVFIDTWAIRERQSYPVSTPWLAQRHGARSSNESNALNATWPYWSSLYDTNNTNLVSLRVEQVPPNTTYELHNITMPVWMARLGETVNRKGITSTLPNLWKMFGCAQAIAEHEARRSAEYTLVVKLRPDGHFWAAASPGIDWAVQRLLDQGRPSPPYRVLVSTIKSAWPGQVSDKYAVGSSAAMRYYLSAWTRVEALWREAERAPTRAPLFDEHLLYAHMRGAPFQFGRIEEAWRAERASSQQSSHPAPRSAQHVHTATHAPSAPLDDALHAVAQPPVGTPPSAANGTACARVPGCCQRHPRACKRRAR